MSLPISTIVDVKISVSPTVPPKAGFGVAGLLSDEFDLDGSFQAERVKYYANITGVGEDWDSDTETYKSALSYFSQSPAPSSFAVISQNPNGVIGLLTGATGHAALATWQAITEGGFTITIGATTKTLSGLDFSGAADLPAVAAIIQSALQLEGGEFATSTCTYDATNLQFVISSGSTSTSVGYMVDATSAGTNGILTGGAIPSLIAAWNAISTGSFAITIGATTADITGIDTTLDADLNEVASAIQIALQAGGGDMAVATVAYDTPNDQFIINSNAVGKSVSVMSAAASGVDITADFKGSVATGAVVTASTPLIVDITTPFLGKQADGAVLTASATPESVTDALTLGELASSGWYGVLLLNKHKDTSVVLDVAAWTEARVKTFSTQTSDPTTLQLGTLDNNAYKLNNLNYQRTIISFTSSLTAYLDAAVLGRAFTTNFSAPDSVITLKFKPLTGVPTETVTVTQKDALDDKRCNVLLDIAGASMYAEGYMSAQLFFDERHSIDWLQGEIESNIFGYLISRPTKVPLTDKGGASLQQQLIRSLDVAVLNGMLATGTTSDGKFLPLGYETVVQKVSDMAIADKANRISPTLSFTALLAGGVHFVQVNGVIER